MSVLDGSNLTLMDIARQHDPAGKELVVAEVLTQKNPIIEDIPFVECNDGMTNLSGVRTGLPEGTWRKLYGGVQAEKSTIKPVRDVCGMLETYSEPDKAVIDMAPNKAKTLMRENRAFIGGLGNTMSKTLFYGDISVTPEKFEGLASRYNKIGTDEDVSYFNVIDGGGKDASGCTSLWLIAFGDDRVYGLYPKGSVGGLQQKDLGEVTVVLSDNSKYQAYRTHYKWDCGLAVADWRYIVRIANIPVSALAAAGDSGYTGPNLTKLLINGLYRMPDDAGNVMIYGNRTLCAALTNLAQSKANLALGIDEFAGKKVTHFWGHQIKRCDSIINTESVVPAAE